jgi:hypothetical protein
MPEKNEIDWFWAIADAIYVMLVGGLGIMAGITMGYWALMILPILAGAMVVNRIDQQKMNEWMDDYEA